MNHEDPSTPEALPSLLELSRLAADLALPLAPAVAQAGDLILRALLAGGKVLSCGNGGSAADAQHFTAELVGRMNIERDPLAAVTLSVDPSIVSAVSNDYGFEEVFARQVAALGNPPDVLVAITTSGSSPNVLRAFETARAKGLGTVSLTGPCADSPLRQSDVFIEIPASRTPLVQELHTAVLHAVCDWVETRVARRS